MRPSNIHEVSRTDGNDKFDDKFIQFVKLKQIMKSSPEINLLKKEL